MKNKLLAFLMVITSATSLLVIGAGHASAADASSNVACVDSGGQPQSSDISVGDNIGSQDTYEGGYPVFACISSYDLIISPTAPAAMAHTITASCPTGTPTFAQKSHDFGGFVQKYVVASCEPRGATLTLQVQDPPGTNNTQFAPSYPYTNDPSHTCPPSCGIDPSPNPEPSPATLHAYEVCNRAGPGQPGGDKNFNVDGCKQEVDQKSADHPLYTTAVEVYCTAFTATMPVDTEAALTARQQAFAQCTTEQLTAAGFVTAADDKSTEPVCNVGGVLGWIICPVVDLMNQAIKAMEGVVLGQLKTPPLSQKDSSGADTSTYMAWNAFRNLADGFFVLIFLIAIFANSLSISLDAYTVKKVLPKLVMAVILVQFSFFIAALAVDVSNVAGVGVGNLVNVLGGSQQHALGYRTLGVSEIFLGAAGVVATLAFVPALIVSVLLLLLSALIGILGVFFTLQLRQIVIEILVITAPIAFVCWVLPNTEKIFKMWYQNFIKVLLMFPMIALLIAVGDLITQIPNGTSNTASQLGAAITPIIIFFMIPATFKASGMMMGAVSGAVLSRSRGASKAAYSGSKKFTKGTVLPSVKERSARMLGRHSLLDDNGKLNMGMRSRMGRIAGRIGSGNAFSVGDIGKRKINATIGAAEAAIRKDNDEILRRLAPDNGKLGEALETGRLVDGTVMDAQMRQAALERLMANKGAPEYAKVFDSVQNDEGKFDAEIASKKWGVSAKQAELIWRGAHEGANGSWAVGNGFRPDGYKGVDAADVSTLAGYRHERVTNFIERNTQEGKTSLVASMMAGVANDFDARAKISRESMGVLKEMVTAGSATYDDALANEQVTINGEQMSMADYAARHIDSNGVITVPAPGGGGGGGGTGGTPTGGGGTTGTGGTPADTFDPLANPDDAASAEAGFGP